VVAQYRVRKAHITEILETGVKLLMPRTGHHNTFSLAAT